MKQTILVLENEPLMLDLVRKIFGDDGFNLLTAETVDDFWALAEVQRIDLFILDLMLPDGSGLEIAKTNLERPHDNAVFKIGSDDFDGHEFGLLGRTDSIDLFQFLVKRQRSENFLIFLLGSGNGRRNGISLFLGYDGPEQRLSPFTAAFR